MRNAISLAPSDRFVIRSAARFFVRAGVPDRAADVLRRSGRVLTDPWLLAADIAVATSMNRTSKNIQSGRRLVDSTSIAPLHLSELGGAIGTIEANSGARKRAQKLFVQALREPTENLIAQVEYMVRATKLLEPSTDLTHLERAHEARANHTFVIKNFDESLRLCWSWLEDEPFSSRPAVLGTVVAGMALQDAEGARQIGEAGLLSHPASPILLNNVAFALADAGRLDEARATRARLSPNAVLTGQNAVSWRATEGLLDFRSEMPEQGRAKYKMALELAQAQKDRPLATKVIAFWLAEELRAKTAAAVTVESFLARELREVSLDSDPYLELALTRLSRLGLKLVR
jgi:hypothetical protein